MTTESIAFNIDDTCNMSVVINDGELYPAYKVQTSKMAEYLKCNAKDLDRYPYHCGRVFFFNLVKDQMQQLISTIHVLEYPRCFDFPY